MVGMCFERISSFIWDYSYENLWDFIWRDS